MTLPTDSRELSPTGSINLSDPGDIVQGKFRYQHAYGVILLVSMATGRSDYTAIWCEQQEDFLAETEIGVFDAYQIKTRKSELGEWQLNDEPFWKSIARFVRLDIRYPDKIRNFLFVSNTQFSNSSIKGREHFSPCKLLTGIKSAVQWEKLIGNAKKGFEWLKDKVGAEATNLFSVLQRLDLVLGPTERAYNDELVQRHITTLKGCESMNVLSLSRVRDSLISMVFKASSRISDNPSRDWVGLMCKLGDDPFLHAKRITVEDIILVVRDAQKPTFCFLPSLASLQLGNTKGNLGTLKQKMYRGGLAAHYETMRRRALSAEQKLLDLASRPNDGDEVVSQIENVVLAECDDAYLRASQREGLYGRTMLIDVQDRLRRISEQEPTRVYRQSYDLLVGVAGMLTSECKVWWSEVFEIEAEL
ncbi:dsDNA nuclease domain-containing protein [Methanosarcina soligelidi]|uniref:dsDNA nuclease domain-containing protein n=1 Tax=Methanosarcina soligelidi TaxID=1036677 RepID=UPI000A87DE85|nr:dsDNA nuclease domain-containing protein [Methanosarcina soligelidi]